MSTSSSRVILCAMTGNGHINPVMVLAEKLALLGLHVTVVFSDKIAYSKAESGATDLDIVFKLLETDEKDVSMHFSVPPAIKRVRSHQQPVSISWPDYSAYQVKFEAFLEEMSFSGCKPVAVIHDYLVTWASGPARKIGISTYVFFASSASNFALSLYLRSLSPSDVVLGSIVQVPGLPAIPADDIWFSSMSTFDPSHGLYHHKKLWEEQLRLAQGVLINSSELIEGKVFEALRRGDIPLAKPLKLVPIGPLVPSYYLDNSGGGASLTTTVIPSKEQAFCSEWLDEQPDRSVIYVSFGSWARLYDEQIIELAAGLEATKLRFLWVLPLFGVADLDDVLPPGFIEQTGARGLIVRGYAPQHFILSHPAVAVFVTHCGWNSTLECIALAGVPMVTWPFLVDQPINSRMLVDELKIAVEVVDNMDGVVDRNEVEKVLKLIIHGDEADTLGKNARELRKRVLKNVQNGVKELLEFAEHIK